MQIAPGTRLGPYEIVSPIGAGGMGEVYRARDTRLDRSVAVKILPAEFATNAQLRTRFEREAKSISQLNHPNICTLFDVGENYLVMELLEGESLADRIARGPIPVSEVLRYAIQIAEGLAQAHRQGIVHRDLKPGNVMITKSGAKLLDFGLAKSQSSILGPRSSVIETEHKPLTAEGTIIGTFQYMAPEQLEGVEADARTDIFAFGTLVYEMITGKKAFEGSTKTSLIAAIVDRDPRPMAQLQPLTPPALEHVVARCLHKHPDDRWQTATDVAAELRWIAQAGSQAGVAVPVARRRRTRESTAWIVAAVLALALVGAGTWMIRERLHRPPAQIVRFALNPTPPLTLYQAGKGLAISPDGRTVAYVCPGPELNQICVRSFDHLETTVLGGTQNGRAPFFSPDGQWIGFSTGIQWHKVPVTGGPVQLLAAGVGADPFWGSDETFLFASPEGIHRVSASGGTSELIIPLDTKKGYFEYRSPSLLPDGHTVLLTTAASLDFMQQTIAVYDLEKHTMRSLRSGTNPRYLPSGHILFAENGSLFLVPFDTRTMTVGTNATSVVQNVATLSATGVASFDVSENGTLVYGFGAVTAPVTTLMWADRQGNLQPLPLPPRPYEHPRISPDGKHVLVAVREREVDVWSLDVDRGTFSRLTFTPTENETPIWSPDGRRVVFSTTRNGIARAHMMKAADGTGSEQTLFSSQIHQHVSSISPDGKLLAVTEFSMQTGSDLWIVPLDGSGPPRVLVKTPFNERAARFSPDGKWIVYSSDESGRSEVYVIGTEGAGKWQVSTSGGSAAIWSRNGREIFYRNADELVGVDVTATASSFSAGVPHTLFKIEMHNLQRGDANYDVTPDGKRFILVRRERESTPPPLLVVTNWFEELRHLAR